MTLNTAQIIRKGYKKTEIGVIPDDWEIKRLGELFDISSSKRVFQSEWKTEGIPFYRARELAILAEEGEVKNELFISKKMYDSFNNVFGVPRIGDILVTGVGTLGKVYVVSDSHEFYFKDGNIIWFKIAAKVNPDFLKQLYLTPLIIKQIENNSAGTTVGTYTISGAKKTTIPFPSLAEQNSIAKVLVDIDALIAILKKHISKKQNIKQGAMQELLIGNKRLPGFSGKWETKKLGEIFLISAGGDLIEESFSEIQDSTYSYPVYSNSLTNKCLYGFSKSFRHNENCITVTARGKIGFANARDHKFDAIGRILILRPLYEMDCFFISEYLNNRVTFSIESTGVPQLTAPQISLYEIAFPPSIEQVAIAQVLSDMDAEIEELEQKLDKYKMIKQGIMQELLTGRTRLI